MTDRDCKGICSSRRDAVARAARVGVGIGVAAATAKFAAGCGSRSNDNHNGNGDAGGTTVTVTSGIATLAFADYPNLKNAGGSYRVSINGKPVSVTRMSTASAVAVVALCTHQGATLGDYSGGSFTCPRHGATFQAAGQVTGGPTNSNLTTYAATIEATGITVKIS